MDMHKAKRKAIFLDRDGTLIEEVNFLSRLEDLRLFTYTAEAIRLLKESGFLIVVVTNQSGVGRGYVTSKALESIHAKLRLLLAEDKVTLDGLYFCPHHPDDRCNCRKPATGMIDRAAAELQVDLSRAYVIGDSARDVELAKLVGVPSLLVMTGPSGTGTLADLTDRGLTPDHVADALPQAVEWIIAHATPRPVVSQVHS